jgi:transposase
LSDRIHQRQRIDDRIVDMRFCGGMDHVVDFADLVRNTLWHGL